MSEENTNIENNNVPLPEEVPVITWEIVRHYRDELLREAEKQYCFDSPKEILDAWAKYKQELRDIPKTFKDLENLHEIRWPDMPNFEQELKPARGL